MKKRLIYIIYFLLYYISFTGYSQTLDIKNFTITAYQGRTEFFDLAQDDDLILYFASNAGIISHNGNDFKTLSLGKELDTKPVLNIVHYDNSLIFSTEEGLYQFFLQQDSLVKLGEHSVVQLEISQDELLFISASELSALDLKTYEIKSLYKHDKSDFTSFSRSRDSFTIGTNEGILLVHHNQLLNSFGSFIDARSILQVSDSLQLILSKNALYSYDQKKILRLMDFGQENTKSLYYSELGDIYVSTANKKLYQYDGIFLNEITPKNGLKNFEINRIRKDRESNLWLLGKGGLSKIALNQPFSQMDQAKVVAIFRAENSVLLVKENSLAQYNFNLKPSFKSFQIDGQIKNCYAAYINSEWILFINDKYIFKWGQDDNLRRVDYDQANTNQIKAFNQHFLSVNESGELYFVDTDLRLISGSPELQSIKTIIHGDDKSYAIQDDQSVYQIKSDGAIEKTRLNISAIKDNSNLRKSKFGLWHFSGKDITLFLNNGREIKITSNIPGLQKNSYIFNLFEDSNLNLWVSYDQSLARISFTENEGSIEQQEIKVFDTSDHLASTYFTDAVELENEQIWFVNENDVTIYNPLLDNPQPVAPGIKVQEAIAVVFDEYGNPKDTINLLSSNKPISTRHEIYITPLLINHYRSSKSHIEYRNISRNTKWNKISVGRKIFLTDLRHGENIIEIQGVSASGHRSDKVESVIIDVKRPIWESSWFYAGAALSALLILGFVGMRTFNTYKDNRTKELNEKLDRELSDLERRSHLQILKSERLKQLNELITSQKGELEKKNKQIESQKYELSLTNEQIKKQKDLLEETSGKLKASINYAQRIQNALMSTEIEIKKAIDDSFVYFQPRDVVSGDFFWFNKVINEKGQELHILAAVDCTGHGVPGAIVSVVGINLLNNITNLKQIYEPGKILNELNKDIIQNLRQNETQVNDGMDMSIVTINTATRQIQFAGAKNPLIYIENGELLRIRGDKHAIGGQQRGGDRDFETHTIDCNDEIKRNFYLFSDGYPDQFGGEKGFKFLSSNFKDLLFDIHQKSVLAQKEALHETLEQWKGDYQQTDDILVIGFKF